MENNNKQPQNFARPNSKACQSSDSNRKTTDLQTNRSWPKNSGRRENPSASHHRSSKQQSASGKPRPNVDKRPRPRAGFSGGGGAGCGGGNYEKNDDTACTADDISTAGTGLASAESGYSTTGAMSKHYANCELNSIYATGSKKQNLNHLLNFNYDHNLIGAGSRGGGGGAVRRQHQDGGSTVHAKRHNKYNKEQFLQANFQFVIRAHGKPPLNSSPDTLIAWDLIEQINIQTTEEPQCPICLYPPIAAKLTRCGHAYCWPCILHYLSLSDKTWRKCPICYDAIHIGDLKSTAIVQQRPVSVGNEITFQLMRRMKGSMIIECYNGETLMNVQPHYPSVTGEEEAKRFSKFLIAKRADIVDIIERERCELTHGEDPSCPEFVFVQQALEVLNQRCGKLGSLAAVDTKSAEERSLGTEEKVVMSAAAVNLNAIDESAAEPMACGQLPVNAVQCPLPSEWHTKYYYFYQSLDGQNIYLHPLNVKMLQACYGSLAQAAPKISARILQKEHHSMDEEHRRKFTCLGHLPLTCQFAVVEVQLEPPLVSEDILHCFKDELLYRHTQRQRRAREECKRERHINAINDRQMGKLIATTARLNLTSSYEFPTCGFEESLVSPSEEQDMIAPPAIGQHASYSTVAVTGGGSAPKVEFWPSLETPHSNSSGSHSQQAAAAWGNKKFVPGPTVSRQRTASTRSSDNEAAEEFLFAAPPATNLSDVLTEALHSQRKQKPFAVGAAVAHLPTAATGANKRKGKRGKMTPLFSTGMTF